MANLVDVYRFDKHKLGKRQLPLFIDDNLTMVMDLNRMGFVYDHPTARGKELEDFLEKFNVLTLSEAREAFQVELKDLVRILGDTIPCVGCRRSVERLYRQLMLSGHPALDPLFITSKGILTIQEDYFSWPHLICTLLHGHSERLNELVESQLRSKKSRRCLLHSLDSQRGRSAWRDVWDVMKQQCREEVALIEASQLLETLENYLRKHRFCAECRTKVVRAYTLLIEVDDPGKEKGYVAALYSGIKRCLHDRHIHLNTRTEYIAGLIARAEPELIGSRRERHAKTLEIAQEEVLTCLGICVYERLHRIYLRLREEECTCMVLAAVAINALCMNFQMAVEIKNGISELELLYEELEKEEEQKLQKKEHKRLKRRRRKDRKQEVEEKENCRCEEEKIEETVCNPSNVFCTCSDVGKPTVERMDRRKVKAMTSAQHHKRKDQSACRYTECEEQHKGADDTTSKQQNGNALSPCQSCMNTQEWLHDSKGGVSREGGGVKDWSSSDHSQDCGYSSENIASSPSAPSSRDGSEVACSEGFCNHEGECNGEAGSGSSHHKDSADLQLLRPNTLSLQQMLEEPCSSDEESFIPAEEVQAFKASNRLLDEKRQELRQTLRKRFAKLCGQLHIAQDL